MKKVKIFTDGSSLGNPGPGGWCALLRYNKHEKILKGGKRSTTNNEMEIKAVLEALKALKEPCEVELYTDSQYIEKAIKEWIHNWTKNNWKTSSKKDVAHKDMWQEIYRLINIHQVKPVWVKAHAGHKENELCDKIAKEEAQKFKNY
ncbi:ribonuclease HI [Persephonella hydrogeniphila]|uniref:Ribonuclease H n=1 Tax=Persephonella hydrogeniphila TaxID=198703 RepID=A0A285NES9_9AQUI|nr:ribonuclease HI [Persephonella hydrogeniphila]SNZ07960.1 ribonuclease HI [Persephonella hydrogeniphila]